MKHIILLLALTSCSTSQTTPDHELIRPRGTCGSPCNSSTQCSDFFGGCRVCFNSFCTDSLPALPIRPDAGVDAAQSTSQETGAEAPLKGPVP